MIARMPARRRRAGRFWPMFVVGLIMMNIAIVALTVFAATRDPSVATEPDYYARALNFNETIRQREANARLAWTAACSFRAEERGTALRLELRDRNGRPIEHATVTATAFASIRSGQRQLLTLTPDALLTGVYTSPIKIDRAGLWVVRVTAEHASGTFTHDTQLLIPANRGGT